MRRPPVSYGHLLVASALFVAAVAVIALIEEARAPSVLFVLAGLEFLVVANYLRRRFAPFLAPRAQRDELDLRTLDRVRDANLVSRDEYETTNDSILRPRG